MVWEWTRPFRARVTDDFGPDNAADFVRLSELRARYGRTWGVYRDEELGGLISYEPVNPIRGTTHCLFKRSFWGASTTETALRMAFREVFEGGAQKITSEIFTDNHAMRSLAKRIGFREIAILTNETLRGGELADMALVELQRKDFDN